MSRLFINMLIYLLIVCYNTYSQTISDVDKDIDIWEELGVDMEEITEYEELYSDLLSLIENPMDINKATLEDFTQLPFLTDQQIESIISYRQKYGELVSLYELKNIETLDFSTIRLLLPYVYIRNNRVENRSITVHNLLKYGRNELILRYDKCFQQKKGYRFLSDSVLADNPNKKYVGEPFYHSLRYIYTYDTNVQAGIIAEKDAGEPFLTSNHKGYDYYSAHLIIKDINRLKTVVIGDYKASFGQGLVFNQGFIPGRSAMVTQVEQKNNGFRRHFSTNEYEYLRGIATTVTFSPVDVSFFYSHRKLDGIMDSCYIRSIKKDGLHRIQRDMERKHIFSISTIGSNIRYSNYRTAIGITGIVTSFGKNILHPEEKPYNIYYLRGNRNLNIGVDYMWKKRWIKVFGETAWSQNNSLATLNAILLSPASYIDMVVLYRYYDKGYQALYGKSFSRHSQIQNEEGVYTGIRISPFPYWKLSAYADVFRFPWLRYGVDAPSQGKEYLVQIDHTFSSAFSLYIRYRSRKNEKNTSATSLRTIQSYVQQKIELHSRVDTEEWLLKATAGYGSYSFEDIQYKGWMFSQAIGWKPSRLPIRMDFFGSWFQTDDYAVRFNSFEKNILYAFYSPTLHGKGLRFTGVIQWNIVKRLILTCKIAHTKYNDRDKIGTGLEEIEGNKKSDIYLQIRWKF